jgi:MFS transporter, DHA1 family, multidrug resistance protein
LDDHVRIPPASIAFTTLLGVLVALPSFGIDMSLPTLAEMSVAFDAAPSQVSWTTSLFMAGFAIAPLLYGPASDRFGRKPVVMIGCALFAVAGAGCAAAGSLQSLLGWRFVQGGGAGAGMTIVLAIIRDLFDGQAARVRFSYVAIATMVAPAIAPAAGASLLALGDWRIIPAALASIGVVLFVVVGIGFTESARLDPMNRLGPSVVFRNYLCVLIHPVSSAYILVGAAAFGALFAYVSGSPLFLINAAGFDPRQYGLIFAATSLAIMLGAFLNGQFSARGVRVASLMTVGLLLSAASSILLLGTTLANWATFPPVMVLLLMSNFGFGLIAPNAMAGAVQPFPQIAGVASAATGFVQVATGAIVSELVAVFYDGRSPLSTAVFMTLCSVFALSWYLLLARPAHSERRPITDIGRPET